MNRLKIQAESLDLELTGDSDYVRDAYEAIRTVVMQRFEKTLRKEEVDEDDDDERARCPTQPLYRLDGVQQHMAASRELADHHIRMVVCNELYHKVAVLTRKDLTESLFGKVIDSKAVEHIYVNEGDVPALTEHIGIGKTLWRELTAHGRAIVHGDSS